MDTTGRRTEIVKILTGAAQPVSASAIAAKLGVSRQIIVGDIALLRAAGTDIQATPRGYLLQGNDAGLSGGTFYTIACRHSDEGLKEELYIIVDNGGGLMDVTVEHPVYGQISGKLHIFSRYDADNFLEKLQQNKASPLCNITNNVHLHTLVCRYREDYERILSVLKEKGILFEEKDA